MFSCGAAPGLGEPLEYRVWPLVEGGDLKRLEGADGETGDQHKARDGDRDKTEAGNSEGKGPKKASNPPSYLLRDCSAACLARRGGGYCSNRS